MTAFDDDPEYEAQLRQLLGDDNSAWRQNANLGSDDEMGEFIQGKGYENGEGNGEVERTFRFRGRRQDEGEGVVSEDARSISTGDDSPSVHVHVATRQC
jgi:hypothetical protein